MWDQHLPFGQHQVEHKFDLHRHHMSTHITCTLLTYQSHKEASTVSPALVNSHHLPKHHQRITVSFQSSSNMRFNMTSILLAAIFVMGAVALHRGEHNPTTTAAFPPNSTEQAYAWEVHNKLREAVGVPPLIWSWEFTEMAQLTADHLAARNNISNYPNHTIYAQQLKYFNPPLDGRGDLLTAADLWALNKPYYNNETIPKGDFDRYCVYS